MNRTSDCFSTLGHIIGQNIFVIFLGFLQVRLLNEERPRTHGLKGKKQEQETNVVLTQAPNGQKRVLEPLGLPSEKTWPWMSLCHPTYWRYFNR